MQARFLGHFEAVWFSGTLALLAHYTPCCPTRNMVIAILVKNAASKKPTDVISS